MYRHVLMYLNHHNLSLIELINLKSQTQLGDAIRNMHIGESLKGNGLRISQRNLSMEGFTTPMRPIVLGHSKHGNGCLLNLCRLRHFL